jgi:hypothetical protein
MAPGSGRHFGSVTWYVVRSPYEINSSLFLLQEMQSS